AQVFAVLAHIRRFGQRCGVADGERHIQNAGQRPGEQRFARACRPDQQDIRLLDFDIRTFVPQRQSLVVVVDGDGQDPFAVLLADHVLVELSDDLLRRRNTREERLRRSSAALFLFQDRLAQVNTLAADVDVARPLDERAYIAVALATERTEGVFFGGARPTAPSGQILSCGHGYSSSVRQPSSVGVSLRERRFPHAEREDYYGRRRNTIPGAARRLPAKVYPPRGRVVASLSARWSSVGGPTQRSAAAGLPGQTASAGRHR